MSLARVLISGGISCRVFDTFRDLNQFIEWGYKYPDKCRYFKENEYFIILQTKETVTIRIHKIVTVNAETLWIAIQKSSKWVKYVG